MNLKDKAIYRLPNGRELVARQIAEHKTILYNLSGADPVGYELNSEGRLLFNGQLTAWAKNDLWDTGQVASSEVTTLLSTRWSPKRDITHEQNL